MPTSKGVKIELSLEAAGAAKSLNEVKSSIKDLKSLALEVGEGGKGFDALTKKANELQDKLGDLKDATSIQGTGVEKLNKSFGLLTESFNNLDLGKAKLAFKSLGETLKNSGPQIILFVLIDVVKSIIENFDKLVNLFPALGTAVKAITDAFHWLTDTLGFTSKAQRELEEQGEKLIEQAEKSKVALENQTSEYDRQITVAKAAGKSTVQIELDKQDAIIRTNKAYLEQVIAHGRAGGQISAEQLKLVNEQLNAIKDAEAQKIAITETAEKTKREENKKTYEENKKLSEKATQDREKEIKEYAEGLAKKRQAEEESSKLILKQLEDTLKKQSDAEAEAADKEFVATENKRAARKAQEQLTLQDKIAALTTEKDATLATIELTEQQRVEIIRKYNEDVKALTEEEFAHKISKINEYSQAVGEVLNSVVGVFSAIAAYQQQERQDEFDAYQQQVDDKIAILDEEKQNELYKAGLTAYEKAKINFKYAQAEYQLKLESFNKENEVKKKAFESSKKLSIATTIIQGAMGAISAFNSFASIPVVGTVLGVIAAAAVGVMTAFQVATINKTKFDGGTPPSPPKFQAPDISNYVSPQSAPSTTSKPEAEAKKAATPAELQKIGGNEPQKIYVVAQDITASQDKNAVLERRTTYE